MNAAINVQLQQLFLQVLCVGGGSKPCPFSAAWQMRVLECHLQIALLCGGFVFLLREGLSKHGFSGPSWT